ncbi:uncharacterized protein LOC125235316 isoform X4 [Leguminivora glycinivorella]|uniref:uncharacterized protein LOC125235316 isoform X4 n=1 Tax=Leguminivora glycinivorella TaxID=1035111 RepID=UPI00200DE1DB|nr:uncharacterized protein LOC125235316 isoform X4 [Leguminivora glycinivorella]
MNRYHRQKCCCVRVEKICYIFAIINVIIIILSVLACIATEALIVTRLAISVIQINFSQFLPTWIVILPIYAVACFLIVSAVFAVLLLQGIRLSKPKLVLAYLFFGLVVETIMIFSAAISIAFVTVIRVPGQNNDLINFGIALAFGICVLYGCILWLVQKTYIILLSRTKNDILNQQTMLYICHES